MFIRTLLPVIRFQLQRAIGAIFGPKCFYAVNGASFPVGLVIVLRILTVARSGFDDCFKAAPHHAHPVERHVIGTHVEAAILHRLFHTGFAHFA